MVKNLADENHGADAAGAKLENEVVDCKNLKEFGCGLEIKKIIYDAGPDGTLSIGTEEAAKVGMDSVETNHSSEFCTESVVRLADCNIQLVQSSDKTFQPDRVDAETEVLELVNSKVKISKSIPPSEIIHSSSEVFAETENETPDGKSLPQFINEAEDRLEVSKNMHVGEAEVKILQDQFSKLSCEESVP